MRYLSAMFLILFPVLLFAQTAETVPPFETNDDKPTNVILIMTDNHGAWTLGCYGNPDIDTPNIDRIAYEGIRFKNAFSSNAVCSPTRATYLTGLIPSQHGVHCFLRRNEAQMGDDTYCTIEEFRSLPKVFKENGYACGLVGKWHLGANMTPQEGFDEDDPATWGDPGRNATCPCGSGKKFKHCHGAA